MHVPVLVEEVRDNVADVRVGGLGEFEGPDVVRDLLQDSIANSL